MKNSGLIKVLKTFSKDEMKEFEKLVASPFFGTGRNLMPLFLFIKKYYPEFDNLNLKKECVFKKLYPGREFNEAVIRKLTSELYYLCIEFIKQTSMRKNPVYVNYCSSIDLANRNLDIIALKLINEMDIDIEKNKIGWNYYVSKSLFNTSKSYYYYNKRSMHFYKEIMRLRSDIFNFVINHFFFNLTFGYSDISLFKKRYEAENLDLKYTSIVDCIDLEKFHKVFREDTDDKSELIMLISLYSLLAIKNPSDIEYFEKFRKLLLENICKIETDLVIEYISLYKRLLLLKENQFPVNKTLQLKFEFNNFILQNNLYVDLYLKVFPKNEFKEFFLTGYKLENYEWSEEFLEKYSKYLNPAERDYTVNLCRSYLFFAKEEFEKCFECLNLINIDHPTEKLAHYYLRSASLFELKFYDESESLLNAFSKFLERDSIAHSKDNDYYVNFIYCLKHLIHFNFTKNKSHLSGVDELLKDESKTVILKNWLVKKLKEAEK